MSQNGQEQEDSYWNELNSRFRGPLLAYFGRRVADASEAEDLTQEVFVRLTRQTAAPHTDAQAFVFVTAANLMRDRARLHTSHRAKAHVSLDDPGAKFDLPVEDRDPERVLLSKDTLREFIIGMESLSERTRDIFVLARIERMHQADIAKLFGISVSAVEKHIMRALKKLGARLAP